MTPTSWTPLLDHGDAAQALQAAAAIAAALVAPTPGQADVPGAPDSTTTHTARALLYAYLERALPGQGHAARAAAAVEASLDAVQRAPLPPALYGGFAGVGWTLEHLRADLPGIDADTNQVIDEALLILLDRTPWHADYDLISGLVGFGVYALERLPHPAGAACLRQVVARLAETAEHNADGITWWTRPELLAPHSRVEYPAGWYNLGVAHGVPGVIALLGEACAAGVADTARPLLDGAVRWLLQQRQPDSATAVFATALPAGPRQPPQHSRLAWCYGDLGVAVALLGAARRAGQPAWQDAALDIARRAAHRADDLCGVVDAGLCHGAGGLGHLFNRLFQATGEPLFADAARRWLRHALSLRQDGQGLGGYLSWTHAPDARLDQPPAPGWFPDASFLGGAAGIALVMLSAARPIAPDWDRLLLSRL